EREADSVRTDGSKLTIRGTLHYLWGEAGFSKWVPNMEGKRNWGTIRKYLLQAAEDKSTKGMDLSDILYIPEVFSVEAKDEIIRRRTARFMKMASDSKTSKMLVLIGEFVKFEEARYGHKMKIKHVPDQGFVVDDKLYARIMKRFKRDIDLVTMDESKSKNIVIGTFSVSAAGLPTMEEVSMIAVNEQWIPYESRYENELMQRLIEKKRKFTHGLRYNMAPDKPLASAVLTDEENTLAVYIETASATDEHKALLHELIETSKVPSLVWKADEEPLPDFER
ncbi:MAG: DUF1173 family protein, partial [Burkholderiales bacterium]